MLFRYRYWIVAGLILLGFIFCWFGLNRTVTVVVDDVPVLVKTRAFTANRVLYHAGFNLRAQDRLTPEKNRFLGWDAVIQLERAVPVVVGIAGTPYLFQAVTSERIPANLLFQAGVALFPGDRIISDGRPVGFSETLPPAASLSLLVERGNPLVIENGNSEQQWYSSAATPLAALWEAGYRLQQSDVIPGSSTAWQQTETRVQISEGRPIIIVDGGQELSSRTSASTVGEALASAGIILNGMDFTRPDESMPVPEDGKIEVIRVTEEVVLEQKALPFNKEYVEDPETELDQTSIVDPGGYGLQVSRIRVIYENGQEVDRITEGEWVAVEPRTQKLGYGTKVVVRTLQTPGGTIEYWRAVPVYATSYSPCNIGIEGKCGSSTASGLPVQQGVIGVIRSWYNQMVGQPVYVPGYGSAVIADIGGGVPGKNWIDLGFSDADYLPWHQDTMLYFLTPVPANIPWTLP
jgi:uncharacterized protein YabE (DUF348 family)